jgi:large repetitive protein
MGKSNAVVRINNSRELCSVPAARRFFALRCFSVAALLVVCLGALLLESCSSSGGEPISIGLTPPTASVDQGQQENFTANLANDLFNQGVTWTLTGTNCVTTGCGALTNVTTTSVTYTAPSGLASSLSVTLTATAVANTTATKTATITVELPLTFTITNSICSTTPTSTQLPCGSNGVPYSATIAVTGGVTPYKFSVVPGSGTLPAGLTLSNSGVITGTPSGPITGQPNPSTFTVQVTDDSTLPVTATQQYSISIAPAAPLAITAVSPLQSGFFNATYDTGISISGGVPPYKWSMTAGSLPPGLFLNNNTGHVSGVPTVPPITPPPTTTSNTFTVQVTDSTLPTSQTQSKQLTINIQTAQPLSISPSTLPGATTATPYTTALSVSGGIPPYTWKQVSGQLPSGLNFAPGTATISGTPVLAGNSTFTVSVSDSEVPTPATTSATYTITVAAGTNNNSLLNGQYTFLFKGFDDNGAVAIVGDMLADGTGKITGGEVDSARAPTPTSTGIVLGQTLTGSYSMGTDGRGTMQLVETNTLNVTLTTDYNLVLDSEGNIHFFMNNSSTLDNDTVHTHGSGIMKPANASSLGASSFNGNYAFVLTGADLAKSPTALGGVIHADGSGSITPGLGDYNEAGTFSPALALSGSFSFDTGTRGAASLTFELPGKSAYTLDYIFDFVSPTDLFFVASDPTDATHPRLSGEFILQSPTIQFSASSALDAPSVATGTGVSGQNSSVYAGLLTPNPATGCAPSTANCVALSYDENNGGTIDAPSFTGNFQIGSNGRVTFSNLGSSTTERLAVAYLIAAEQGLTMGSDAAVTTGELDQQETGVTFSSSLVDGEYTLSAAFPAEPAVNSVIGQVNADGSVNMTGIVDELTPPLTPKLGQILAATYNITSATTGRGTINLNPLVGLPSTMAFYVVSPSSFRAISTDSADQHPEVFFFDH